MSTHRHIDAVCLAVLVLAIVLTLLFMNGEAFGLQPIIDEDAENFSGSSRFTENDRSGNWDTAGATQIVLRGSSASVSGGGAFAYDGNAVITNAGKYVISGALEDGCILVSADSSAKVWILLDGASVTCSDGAALDIEQADKVFLTLAEGSENALVSTGISEGNTTAGMDAALFARDDLTINGAGALTVRSDTAHGITANDDLVITGGALTVTAASDALHANDALRIMSAALTLQAGDDGLALTGTESELYIESGTISVRAADKGVNAANTFCFCSGTLEIEAVNDGISAGSSLRIDGGTVTISSEDDAIHSDTGVTVTGGTILIPSCYEGIEAVTIEITGGDLTIYPVDDGLNANGAAGTFGMPGGGMPGGMRGDSQKTAEGGPRDGASFERPEGAFPDGGPPEMPQGEFPDGQAPELPEPPDMEGMPDMTGENAPPKQNSGIPADEGISDTAAETQETWIHISGGNITIVNETARDADGLDSNGDIIISGGVIRVSLVNSGSNNALDYGSESGGVMEISGGEVIACGSYSMAEGFDASSTQCAILYNIRRGISAGTTVSLEDSEGNVLVSYEVPCSFSSVAISCPQMKLGESYTVVVGDTAEEITLEEVSASYGDAQSGGFGGNMNWGGGHFRPDMGSMRQFPADSAETDS